MSRIFCLVLLTAGWTNAEVVYRVQLTNNAGNRLVELPAEQYVAAAVAGEANVFRNDEALKAMAVAVRTCAARMRGRHASEGFDFCATTHCQRVEPGNITAHVAAAARATAGELLWFEAKPALSVYTKDCGGEAEAVDAVWPDIRAPYLKVHADPYCGRAGPATWEWEASPREIAQALLESKLHAPERLKRIEILSRTPSGRAKYLELEGEGNPVRLSASSLRFAVGRSLGWNMIRSDRYDLDGHMGRLIFRGMGEGHGVGLCQLGADEMAEEGHSYREILAFYFPGTKLSVIGTGLAWVRLAGEGIVLYTSYPGRDQKVVLAAEQLLRTLKQELRWDQRQAAEIRVYPDLETFRNATGEPGWVAAHTEGFRVDLQPTEVLQSRGILRGTLRHELLHVFVESQAAAEVPVWFREGLVECLDHPGKPMALTPALDQTGLQQRHDRRQADDAYNSAKLQVSRLVDRYGKAAVLTWLARGLPPDVKNSSDIKAATKTR